MSQDWNEIVFRKKAPSAKDAKAVTNAQRTGAAIETSKKAATNKPTTTTGNPARRLESDIIKGIDEEPDKLTPKTVGRAIQAARVAKGLTQAQLAQRINQKATVVNELEQGKALFNNQMLGQLERQLGVKLRGDKALIGTPLEAKTFKGGAK